MGGGRGPPSTQTQNKFSSTAEGYPYRGRTPPNQKSEGAVTSTTLFARPWWCGNLVQVDRCSPAVALHSSLVVRCCHWIISQWIVAGRGSGVSPGWFFVARPLPLVARLFMLVALVLLLLALLILVLVLLVLLFLPLVFFIVLVLAVLVLLVVIIFVFVTGAVVELLVVVLAVVAAVFFVGVLVVVVVVVVFSSSALVARRSLLFCPMPVTLRLLHVAHRSSLVARCSPLAAFGSSLDACCSCCCWC